MAEIISFAQHMQEMGLPLWVPAIGYPIWKLANAVSKLDRRIFALELQKGVAGE